MLPTAIEVVTLFVDDLGSADRFYQKVLDTRRVFSFRPKRAIRVVLFAASHAGLFSPCLLPSSGL